MTREEAKREILFAKREVMADSYIDKAYDVAIKALEQPEIIRCKGCKHRMPYDWMFSEVWQSQNMDDYQDNEIGCQYCDMSMTADDFCSHAERREEGK